MGTEPPESSEYDVWVNPNGSPFTAEWENVEDKPFETLSSDFDVQDGELHVVGGTGGASSWEDLEDKPFESIGSGLSVDGSGVLNTDPIDYSDIQNTPTIPSTTSDLTNDSGFITNAVNDLVNYTPSNALSSVATSGSYTDLTNKPSIPDSTSDLVNDSGFITSADIPADVSDFNNDAGYITSADIPDWNGLSNKPFESIGSGLSVDSEGVLSSQGGGSGGIDIIKTIDIEALDWQ